LLFLAALVGDLNLQQTLFDIIFAVMSACKILIVGKMAELIWSKCGTRICLDPEIVLGKSRSRPESCWHENGGTIGADSFRPEDRH